jgi:hypothetical protein
MFDEILRKSIDPVLEKVATQLSGAGIRPGWLIAGSLLLGIGAAALLARHSYIFGLVVFALSRICALLGGGRGRKDHPASAYFGFSFDLIVYGLLAFGFALGDPSRALASSFLMLALVVLASSTLAFAQISVQRAPVSHNRSAASLTGAIIFAAFTLACLEPNQFSLLAYTGGLASFAAAGSYIATALARADQS